jgi:hypothetical protein
MISICEHGDLAGPVGPDWDPKESLAKRVSRVIVQF